MDSDITMWFRSCRRNNRAMPPPLCVGFFKSEISVGVAGEKHGTFEVVVGFQYSRILNAASMEAFSGSAWRICQ